MFNGLGYFKYILLFQFLLGIHCPSLSGLSHSPWTRGYCVSLLLAQTIYFLWYVSFTPFPSSYFYVVLSNTAIILFVMTHALYDCNTQVSAALELNCVDVLLDDPSIGGGRRDRSDVGYHVLCGAAVLTSCLWNVLIMSRSGSDMNIPVAVSMTFVYAFDNVLATGYFTYNLKILKIHRKIKDLLQNIVNIDRDSDSSSTSRITWGEPPVDLVKLIKLVREVEGSLHGTAERVFTWYRVFVIYTALVNGLSMPKFVVLFRSDVYFVIVIGAFKSVMKIAAVICIFERINRVKKDTTFVMSALLTRGGRPADRKALEHLVLAASHRRYSPYCWFFDVGYELGAAILETSLLVVCTMLGQ